MQKKEKYSWFATTILFRLLIRFEYEITRLSQTDDIEALHQARVYIRRLRVAFSLFEDILSTTGNVQWCEDIIKVGKSLREARDLDVQIEKLHTFLGQANTLSDRAAISALIETLIQIRESYQQDIRNGQHRFFDKKPFRAAKKCMRAILTKKYSHASIRQAIDKTIDRVSQINIQQADILSMSAEALHDFRKEIRYLRYELEIIKIYHPEKDISRAIKDIKPLQETLGDIHDNDVWISYLAACINRENIRVNIPRESLQAVIEGLIDQQKTSRAQAFSNLIEQADDMRQTGFWKKLAQTLIAYA